MLLTALGTARFDKHSTDWTLRFVIAFKALEPVALITSVDD